MFCLVSPQQWLWQGNIMPFMSHVNSRSNRPSRSELFTESIANPKATAYYSLGRALGAMWLGAITINPSLRAFIATCLQSDTKMINQFVRVLLTFDLWDVRAFLAGHIEGRLRRTQLAFCSGMVETRSNVVSIRWNPGDRRGNPMQVRGSSRSRESAVGAGVPNEHTRSRFLYDQEFK